MVSTPRTVCVWRDRPWELRHHLLRRIGTLRGEGRGRDALRGHQLELSVLVVPELD